MSDYRKQIDLAKAGIDKKLSKVVRLSALAVYGEVVKNTPVDTGRAKGNWWAGMNDVPATIHDAEDKTSGASLQREAESKSREAIQAFKPGSKIYISNNLPYIRRLNDGYSKQAPASFVESAAQVGVAKAKQIAKTRFGDEL
ncbi:MAG: hypothetical protein CMM93_02345 [Rickettsiales bacterium]|nr:hypothetical protein [Rickettsiales bacterium]|tara:strand:+ start:287 stop:712 length:426 start_codon:yes stop_codon:yes gene_type:complete